MNRNGKTEESEVLRKIEKGNWEGATGVRKTESGRGRKNERLMCGLPKVSALR